MLYMYRVDCQPSTLASLLGQTTLSTDQQHPPSRYKWMAGKKVKKKFNVKLSIFLYPSVITYVFGAQKNRLIETVLLSTHNICFG